MFPKFANQLGWIRKQLTSIFETWFFQFDPCDSESGRENIQLNIDKCIKKWLPVSLNNAQPSSQHLFCTYHINDKIDFDSKHNFFEKIMRARTEFTLAFVFIRLFEIILCTVILISLCFRKGDNTPYQ